MSAGEGKAVTEVDNMYVENNYCPVYSLITKMLLNCAVMLAMSSLQALNTKFR